jgi:hypothetical protein
MLSSIGGIGFEELTVIFFNLCLPALLLKLFMF